VSGRAGGRARRPSFATVRQAYPTTTAVSRPQLFHELGIEALIGDFAYENTCGIRMSYALTKAGVVLTRGGLRINKGPFQGRRIEPSMRKLAEHLVELWGPPQKFDSNAKAADDLTLQQGVIAFFFGEFLPLVNAQGHIDLLLPRWPGFEECVGSCNFGRDNKVWFWPLP
jgi:hypothetical protein